MKKLILRVEDNISDEDALQYTQSVVRMGKISKTSKSKQYSFHSVVKGYIHVVCTRRSTTTQTFYIYKGNPL